MKMKQDVKLIEQCLDEMYRNSEPPLTWKQVNKKYSGKPDSKFYSKHRITEDKYEQIRDKYMKKLSKLGQSELSWILLDFAPAFKN